MVRDKKEDTANTGAVQDKAFMVRDKHAPEAAVKDNAFMVRDEPAAPKTTGKVHDNAFMVREKEPGKTT